MGTSKNELPLWKVAHRAIWVHPSTRVLKRNRSMSYVEQVLAHQASALALWLVLPLAVYVIGQRFAPSYLYISVIALSGIVSQLLVEAVQRATASMWGYGSSDYLASPRLLICSGGERDDQSHAASFAVALFPAIKSYREKNMKTTAAPTHGFWRGFLNIPMNCRRKRRSISMRCSYDPSIAHANTLLFLDGISIQSRVI
jgi:hypothetical protein